MDGWMLGWLTDWMARRGPCPDGLVELLEAANRIVHEAPEDDAELMLDLF